MDHFGYLPQVVLLLGAAILIVTVFKRLQLSPVLGYLVAGAAIGEYGFGQLHSEDFNTFAEFGIVFLLFAIGLELTFERLMAMRSHVFGFGSLQVCVTSLLFFVIAYYLFGVSLEASIVIGGALSLSSTAIVLKVLTETNGHTTQVGRLSLANLLLQDFAVIPLLVLVPLLVQQDSGGGLLTSIGTAMLKAMITMVMIFFIGRLLLRPLFKVIASFKSNELFIATTLFLVLGTSYITLSVGGSLAMGAFLAGLLVAETQYQHQVEEDILPFKDLLMGLFFMTIGMSISLQLIYDNMLFILGISILVISVKVIVITLLSRLFRFSWHLAIHAGLLLSQGSEFAFILFNLASDDKIALLTNDQAQLLLTIVTVTMAATPVFATVGRRIVRWIEAGNDKSGDVQEEIDDLNHHVVIIGFEPSGEMVAKMLEAQKIHYVALDPDSRIVNEAKRRGFCISKGDPHKIDSLRAIGVERAKTVIITLNDMVLTKKTIRAVSRYFPDIPIIVSAEDLRYLKSLTTIGATIVVPERHEAGLQLAGELLTAMGLSDFEVSQLKNEFRSRNYDMSSDTPPIEAQ